jgi:hypothetical protein
MMEVPRDGWAVPQFYLRNGLVGRAGAVELDGDGLHLRVTQGTLREEDAAATLARIASGEWARCVLPWLPLMR